MRKVDDNIHPTGYPLPRCDHECPRKPTSHHCPTAPCCFVAARKLKRDVSFLDWRGAKTAPASFWAGARGKSAIIDCPQKSICIAEMKPSIDFVSKLLLLRVECPTCEAHPGKKTQLGWEDDDWSKKVCSIGSLVSEKETRQRSERSDRVWCQDLIPAHALHTRKTQIRGIFSLISDTCLHSMHTMPLSLLSIRCNEASKHYSRARVACHAGSHEFPRIHCVSPAFIRIWFWNKHQPPPADDGIIRGAAAV